MGSSLRTIVRPSSVRIDSPVISRSGVPDIGRSFPKKLSPGMLMLPAVSTVIGDGRRAGPGDQAREDLAPAGVGSGAELGRGRGIADRKPLDVGRVQRDRRAQDRAERDGDHAAQGEPGTATGFAGRPPPERGSSGSSGGLSEADRRSITAWIMSVPMLTRMTKTEDAGVASWINGMSRWPTASTRRVPRPGNATVISV